MSTYVRGPLRCQKGPIWVKKQVLFSTPISTQSQLKMRQNDGIFFRRKKMPLWWGKGPPKGGGKPRKGAPLAGAPPFLREELLISLEEKITSGDFFSKEINNSCIKIPFLWKRRGSFSFLDVSQEMVSLYVEEIFWKWQEWPKGTDVISKIFPTPKMTQHRR